MRHDLIAMGQLSSAPEVSIVDRSETAGDMMQAPESLAQGQLTGIDLYCFSDCDTYASFDLGDLLKHISFEDKI